MPLSDEIVAKIKKEQGDRAIEHGLKVVDVPRLPTGFFPFDLASFGGLPLGQSTMLYGPESSGKTNMALKCIANHQRIYPDKVCVLIAFETVDGKWARALGVDTEKLLVAQPVHAEQGVDMAYELANAEDVGLIVVDSLAAMMTGREEESSSEKAIVGGNSVIIGKMCRKLNLACQQAYQDDRMFTSIWINQLRYKVAIKFGNPETMPGGMAPKHHASMIVRLYGKNVMKESVSRVMPVIKKTDAMIQKWKVPIIATVATFDMVAIAHSGLAVGQCDDWAMVSNYLREGGFLSGSSKSKKPWVMMGQDYPTLTACRKALVADPELEAKAKQLIFNSVAASSEIEGYEAEEDD